jgi:acetyltransferase EpsM
MLSLVIWGASGHALVVADIVRLVGEYRIVGFLDDLNPHRRDTEFCGAPILGGREQLPRLAGLGVTHLLFGFGDCDARLELSSLARQHGLSLASAIHPRATIAMDVAVGPGTVIAAGAIINPGAVVGENVIVNTSASIDHECVVEDGAHICPGARLAGCVTVGRGAWVGLGATIIDHVKIGAGAFVGAGAVVTRDVPERVLVYGVPARVVRHIEPKHR